MPLSGEKGRRPLPETLKGAAFMKKIMVLLLAMTLLIPSFTFAEVGEDNDFVTRAEFARIIVRMLRFDGVLPNSTVFSDVTQEHPLSGYV